jgi:hypothetical protein
VTTQSGPEGGTRHPLGHQLRRRHHSTLHLSQSRLGQRQAAVGGWIVYRGPRRGSGRQGYVSVAHLLSITAHPASAGHSYAHAADFLGFDSVVPLRGAEGFYEGLLARVANSSLAGRELQGKSVRLIPDAEFGAIVRAGLQDTLVPANAHRLELDPRHAAPETLALVLRGPRGGPPRPRPMGLTAGRRLLSGTAARLGSAGIGQAQRMHATTYPETVRGLAQRRPATSRPSPGCRRVPGSCLS